MIEVYDIRDAEPEKLDITPELALAAYNTLIQFCTKQSVSNDGCEGCVFLKACPGGQYEIPADWEEIHYPKLVDNSVFYLKDGKVREIVHANRQEAEETLKEMMKRYIKIMRVIRIRLPDRQ